MVDKFKISFVNGHSFLEDFIEDILKIDCVGLYRLESFDYTTP